MRVGCRASSCHLSPCCTACGWVDPRPTHPLSLPTSMSPCLLLQLAELLAGRASQLSELQVLLSAAEARALEQQAHLQQAQAVSQFIAIV